MHDVLEYDGIFAVLKRLIAARGGHWKITASNPHVRLKNYRQMNKPAICLILFLIACTVNAAVRETIFSPDDGEDIFVVNKPREMVYSTAEKGGRRCALFQWKNAKAHWNEVRIARDFPDIRFKKCKVLVDVFLERSGDVPGHINLRFKDRYDKIFQYQVKLKKQTGWQTAECEVDFPASLHELIVGFGNGTGLIGVGKICVEVGACPLNIKLETGNAVHVLKADENVIPQLRLVNYNTNALKVNAGWTVKNFEGRKLYSGRVPPEIAAGESVAVPLKRPELFGVYTVEVLGESGGEGVYAKMNFAYMHPAGPTPGKSAGFHFGVHNHSDSYTPKVQERCAEAAALCGIKVHRMGNCIRQAHENAPYDFSFGDRLVQRFEKYGIEPQIIMSGYLHPWDIDRSVKPVKKFGKGKTESNFPKLENWGKRARAFMEYFKGRVRFVETWNEPDLIYSANFSKENYVKLQKSLFENAHAVDSGVKVLTGGYAVIDNADVPDCAVNYVQDTLAAAKGAYDVIAFHGHGTFKEYIHYVSMLDKIRRECGLENVPWWSNETAITAAHAGETVQAETLFKKLLFCMANGGIGYTWYNIRNKGFLPHDWESNFGLITRDFYPKPVYVVYNTLVGYFRNARYVKQYKTPEGCQMYCFRAANGSWLLPNWNVSVSSPCLITFKNITGEVFKVDMFGNRNRLDVSGGVVSVEGGSAPMIIEVAAQDTVPEDVSFKRMNPNKSNEPVIALDDNGKFPDSPHLVIDRASQVETLLVSEPSNAPLYWSGKDDLSAEVFLSADETCLGVRVVVHDDVHCQKNNTPLMWLGDSVIVLLKLPGEERMVKIGMSAAESGGARLFVYSSPEKTGNFTDSLDGAMKRNEETKTTVYTLKIPFAALKLSVRDLKRPLAINIGINDNDGTCRESLMVVAPGFDECNPEFYPLVEFRKNDLPED